MKQAFEQTDYEMVDCPVCNGAEFVPLLSNDRYLMGLKTVGCKTCGMVLTNPQPTEDALRRFYEQDYRFYYQKVVTPSESYIKRYKKDLRAQLTADFLVRTKVLFDGVRVLDVGAGEGCILAAITNRFKAGAVLAVEPNPDFGRFAESYADCAVVPDLASVGELEFDLVILNHVLEHIKKPHEFLLAIKRYIAPGGKLYIDVPSVEEYSSMDDFHIGHVNHFSSRSLKNLLLITGYEPYLIEKHTPVKHPRSIRCVCSVGAVQQPMIGSQCHEGWDACSAANHDLWKVKLRHSSAWKLMVSMKNSFLSTSDKQA